MRELLGRGILRDCQDLDIWVRKVQHRMGRDGIMSGNISEFYTPNCFLNEWSASTAMALGEPAERHSLCEYSLRINANMIE